MARNLNLKLKIWRQPDAKSKGTFQTVEAKDIPESASFLEMLDIVNQRIIDGGGDPVAFDHDCREGICGTCSMVINGVPHGPERATTTCQLHMRKFKTGDTLWVEPFRAKAFPVIKDLAVDRSAFDTIMRAGGFISVRTGGAQDANCLPISKVNADAAMAGRTLPEDRRIKRPWLNFSIFRIGRVISHHGEVSLESGRSIHALLFISTPLLLQPQLGELSLPKNQ